MATETLEVVIKATNTGFDKVVGGASSALSGLANIGKTVLTAGLAVGAAAVAGLAAGLGLAVKEAMEAQEGLAQLDAVLESTGGAAGVTRDMALELADSLSTVTRFSDDAILAGENMLLTFTNIGADVFPRATETLLDMATAMGTDAKSGAIQLGKALNDPVAGITALTRVGVTFTEEQKKAIQAMVDMGDIAGAQTIILDELAKEFGGSAEAAGQTFAGQLDILKNSLLNVAEGVGTALLPILQDLTGFVTENVLPWVVGIGEEFARLLGIFRDVGWEDFFVTFEDGSSWVGSFFEQLGFGEETANKIGTAINGFAQKLKDAWDWINTDGKQILEDFRLKLFEVGEWINGDGKAAFDNFLLALQPIVTGFQGLTAAFIESLPIIQENAQIFADWFMENFWPVIQQVIENIKGIFHSLVAMTGSDLTEMTGFWQEHGETVIGIITTAFQVITTTIGGAINIITGVVNAWLLLWQGDTQGALDVLQNTFHTFFESVLSLVGTNSVEFVTTWTGTFELISLAFNTWKDQLLLDLSTWFLNFLGTWQTNWDQFSLIVDTIIQNIQGFFANLKQTINDVIATVAGLIAKILSIPGIPGGSTTTSAGDTGAINNQTAAGAAQGDTVEGLLAQGDLLGAMEAARGSLLGGGGKGSGRTRIGQGNGGTKGLTTFSQVSNEGGGNIIYQLIIHSQAKTENLIDDFNMLKEAAALG